MIRPYAALRKTARQAAKAEAERVPAFVGGGGTVRFEEATGAGVRPSGRRPGADPME